MKHKTYLQALNDMKAHTYIIGLLQVSVKDIP